MNIKWGKTCCIGNAATITEHAAALIISEAYAAVAEHGRFSLVVAGGDTPRQLYRHLAMGVDTDRFKHYELKLPGREQTQWNGKITVMPWKQTWLFWGDERCVPIDNPGSNYRMVKETLLLHSPVPEDHIIRMHAELPDTVLAAENYEDAIRTFFSSADILSQENSPVFDFVLLGLGQDGHTASLFADNPDSLKEKIRWVLSVDAPHADPPGKRLTLTLPIINKAHNIAFFTSGKDKAELAAKIFNREVTGVPAALVDPEQGNMFWFAAHP
jgi:6-phosphogluconolactonase